MFPCSWAVSKWPHLGKRAHDDCVGKLASPKMDFRHRRRRFERIDPDDIVQVPSNIFGLIILYLKSLLYNENTSFSYSFRTAFNPVLSFIEMHMAFFGPFFTVVIFVMLLVYVTIAYLIGVPYWLDRSPTTFYIAAFIGHWLLINVTFYYYKALVTSPGHPSDRLNITEVSSFCKKCLGPKPPRAHHCRICKKCILTMDHHCPWLNNCIGHYNHRYFFLFCFFAWLGTVFVGVFGIWIYIDHFYPRHSIFQEPIYHKYDGQEFSQEFIYLDQTYVILGLFEVSHANLRGKGVLYVFWCSLLIFILVGALLAYHSLLITKGETCIERHINRKNKEACKRFKRRFHNPYDFGARQNWRNFLLGDKARDSNCSYGPLISLIVPLDNPPIGDGFTWQKVEQGFI